MGTGLSSSLMSSSTSVQPRDRSRGRHPPPAPAGPLSRAACRLRPRLASLATPRPRRSPRRPRPAGRNEAHPAARAPARWPAGNTGRWTPSSPAKHPDGQHHRRAVRRSLRQRHRRTARAGLRGGCPSGRGRAASRRPFAGAASDGRMRFCIRVGGEVTRFSSTRHACRGRWRSCRQACGATWSRSVAWSRQPRATFIPSVCFAQLSFFGLGTGRHGADSHVGFTCESFTHART